MPKPNKNRQASSSKKPTNLVGASNSRVSLTDDGIPTPLPLRDCSIEDRDKELSDLRNEVLTFKLHHQFMANGLLKRSSSERDAMDAVAEHDDVEKEFVSRAKARIDHLENNILEFRTEVEGLFSEIGVKDLCAKPIETPLDSQELQNIEESNKELLYENVDLLVAKNRIKLLENELSQIELNITELSNHDKLIKSVEKPAESDALKLLKVYLINKLGNLVPELSDQLTNLKFLASTLDELVARMIFYLDSTLCKVAEKIGNRIFDEMDVNRSSNSSVIIPDQESVTKVDASEEKDSA